MSERNSTVWAVFARVRLILLANPIFGKVNEDAIAGNFVSLDCKRDSHVRGFGSGRRGI